MRINQIAASDAVTQNFLASVLNFNTLLRNHVEFYIKPGDSAVSRKEQDGIDASTRALDSDYVATNGKPEYVTAKRTIFGGSVTMDVARERMGFDIASEMLGQLRREAPGISKMFNNLLINGDSSTDSKQFSGLKKLVTSGQTFAVATNGLQLAFGNKQDTANSDVFLEKLDQTINSCAGTSKVILCNGTVLARINNIARPYIQVSADTFGRPVTRYNQIPLVNIEENGNSILPFTETVGTATKCSSIYVVSFEEEAGYSFLTTPEGFKVYPMEKVNNNYKHQIDFILDSVLLRDKAIAKLSGLYL